jgi:hypothetical protein
MALITKLSGLLKAITYTIRVIFRPNFKIVSVADIHPYKIVTLLCKTMVRHGGRQPHRLCHESRISHSTESLISGYKCLNPLGRFGGMGLIIEFDFSDCFQRVYIQKVTGRQSSVLPFHPPI